MTRFGLSLGTSRHRPPRHSSEIPPLIPRKADNVKMEGKPSESG
jgi:hypothetical protein